MKKALIYLFATLAVMLLVIGIINMNYVDIIELQHNGLSYRDALKIQSDAHTEGINCIASSVVCLVFSFALSKIKNL